MSELKPCKCGCHKLDWVHNAPRSTTIYNYIECPECGATSGSFPTKREAIDDWNRRVKENDDGNS